VVVLIATKHDPTAKFSILLVARPEIADIFDTDVIMLDIEYVDHPSKSHSVDDFRVGRN
jgi:hypothetical protein